MERMTPVPVSACGMEGGAERSSSCSQLLYPGSDPEGTGSAERGARPPLNKTARAVRETIKASAMRKPIRPLWRCWGGLGGRYFWGGITTAGGGEKGRGRLLPGAALPEPIASIVHRRNLPAPWGAQFSVKIPARTGGHGGEGPPARPSSQRICRRGVKHTRPDERGPRRRPKENVTEEPGRTQARVRVKVKLVTPSSLVTG